MEPTFSIILPIYKQAQQIQTLYDSYTSALARIEDSWELLFIVNGPEDGSYELAVELARQNNNVHVHRADVNGWGGAIQSGLTAARGKYICYTNSARTQINDLVLMLKYAKVNDQVVIKATRIIRESFLRKLGSVLYNFENRILFKTPIWDVNGTPKIIPKKILEGLEIISNDDLIDAEIMAKCFKKGIPIIEIPVVITKRISGKSTTNFYSAFKMYFGLLRIKRKL